jgi:hypothetical protein
VVSDSLPQYQNSIMQIHAVVTLPKPKRQHRLVATAGISTRRFSWLSCPADVVAIQVAGLAVDT